MALAGLALAALLASPPAAAARPALPFIDDDYPKALAEARARKLPIFAEAWAPWCHTCRSMRAFVFTDPNLAKYASRYVWLSIDTEKSQNAAFSQKYPIRAWPSMYVIDPGQETIAVRWVGGATVGQLEKLFVDGERAVRGDTRGAAQTLAAADKLYGQGRYADAVPAYREALKVLAVGSPEYSRAVDALLFSLSVSKEYAECAATARAALPRLRTGPSAAAVAGSGLDCALQMPADAPGRAEAVGAFEADVRAIVVNRRIPLAADDRSALYSSIVDAREDAKDEAGARKVALAWVAYLDAEAAAVRTPEQRTALDPNRLGAFDAAGQLEKAIPMLEQSEKDFPDDYNPPARLALVYKKLRRYDVALAASDRALARVYGPRRIRVLTLRVEIYEGLGDTAAARQALEEAHRFADALPAGQRSESEVAALQKRLDSASGPSQASARKP
jgi:tetratricopeptide (TPR) repeat protein